MIGNLLTKGPDKKTHRYPPNRRPPPPSRPQSPYSSRYPNTQNNRPPRQSIKYPLKLPIVQDTRGHPYPPQPNGATFSFQAKPQNPKPPVTLSRAYDRGFLPSAPYWKTYDHLYKPNLTLTTTTESPAINEFVEFIKPPTSLIAPGVNQALFNSRPESTTNEPFLRLEEHTTVPLNNNLDSTTATNFNPLNFNQQLNVASILSHLDDEDIEAIQEELSGVISDTRQLPPNLQEWYNTLENKNRSQSISLKRQVTPNQFQRGGNYHYFKPNQFQLLVKQQQQPLHNK